MKYLLDTNTCIRYLNGRAPQLRVKLAATPLSEIAVSSITKAEMFYGSAKSQTPEQSLRKQLEFLNALNTIPFNDAAALIYGSVRVTLERAGTPIGHYDMLIAAIGLANDLILVTHNVREFARIPELNVEDWELP
jgi:tRNA(fMet)-specific endonuclease VapC